MRLEQFHASFIAVLAFLVVEALCLVIILAATTFVGFYWDIWTIWGRGLNSDVAELLYLVVGLLTLLSLYFAYRCARKVRQFVLRYEMSR